MLSPERESARMSNITNDGLMMLYSCTHMTTVGVKGLNDKRRQILHASYLCVSQFCVVN